MNRACVCLLAVLVSCAMAQQTGLTEPTYFSNIKDLGYVLTSPPGRIYNDSSLKLYNLNASITSYTQVYYDPYTYEFEDKDGNKQVWAMNFGYLYANLILKFDMSKVDWTPVSGYTKGIEFALGLNTMKLQGDHLVCRVEYDGVSTLPDGFSNYVCKEYYIQDNVTVDTQYEFCDLDATNSSLINATFDAATCDSNICTFNAKFWRFFDGATVDTTADYPQNAECPYTPTSLGRGKNYMSYFYEAYQKQVDASTDIGYYSKISDFTQGTAFIYLGWDIGKDYSMMLSSASSLLLALLFFVYA